MCDLPAYSSLSELFFAKLNTAQGDPCAVRLYEAAAALFLFRLAEGADVQHGQHEGDHDGDAARVA